MFSKTRKRKQKSSYHIILAANCATKFVSLFASKNLAGIFLALACMHACVIFPPPLFDVQKTEHEFKKGDVIMVLLQNWAKCRQGAHTCPVSKLYSCLSHKHGPRDTIYISNKVKAIDKCLLCHRIWMIDTLLARRCWIK
jgi:hypothetical protein